MVAPLEIPGIEILDRHDMAVQHLALHEPSLVDLVGHVAAGRARLDRFVVFLVDLAEGGAVQQRVGFEQLEPAVEFLQRQFELALGDAVGHVVRGGGAPGEVAPGVVVLLDGAVLLLLLLLLFLLLLLLLLLWVEVWRGVHGPKGFAVFAKVPWADADSFLDGFDPSVGRVAGRGWGRIRIFESGGSAESLLFRTGSFFGVLGFEHFLDAAVAHFVELLAQDSEAFGCVVFFRSVERFDFAELFIQKGEELGLSYVELFVSFQGNIGA